MSRVVVKVSYHNPRTSSKNIAGYAEYIAKREGVEIRNQDKARPPDTTYADYIATRPGVETRGSHGLFSIEDRPISLSKVSNELKEYSGNVWTVIISLKREDAIKTGFDNSEAWRELISEKAEDIAKNFNLPVSALNCYAAFHDAGEHPHIHMIVYSKDPKVHPGYHKQSSLQKLKSVFTRKIFEEELSDIYKHKSEFRDLLREEAIERIRTLANDVKTNKNVEPNIVSKFIHLSEQLEGINGKKVYGYMPEEIKTLVDDLLKDISSDPRLTELYNKWYEQKEIQQEFYNSNKPERIPIEKNEEFRSIKNAIVREASRLHLSHKENEQQQTAASIAVDDLIDMLCQIYVSGADDMELNDDGQEDSIKEIQDEVDEALGIKHDNKHGGISNV